MLQVLVMIITWCGRGRAHKSVPIHLRRLRGCYFLPVVPYSARLQGGLEGRRLGEAGALASPDAEGISLEVGVLVHHLLCLWSLEDLLFWRLLKTLAVEENQTTSQSYYVQQVLDVSTSRPTNTA